MYITNKLNRYSMANKKITLNEEKAAFLDIKSAISLAMFDSELSRYDGSIDIDVRRAVIYNKVVFENMIKRLFSYAACKDCKKYVLKEKDIIKMLDANPNEKLYYIESPNENTFNFLIDILDEKKKVRGYSEYVLYSLFNHYFDYIKN